MAGGPFQGIPKAQDLRNRAQRFKGIPAVAIEQYQICVATGTDRFYPNVTLAEADNVLHAFLPLFLAHQDAVVDGGEPTAQLLLFGKVDGVDTSAANVGDPVFLSDTAGGWSVTPGTFRRRIGWVTEAASSGGFIFDGGAPVQVVSGTATISAASNSVTVTVGAAAAGGLVGNPITVSINQASEDSTLTRVRAYWNSNNLVIAGNANATADTTVAYQVSV